MNLQEKIQAIADHYGIGIQLLKLAEECAEYSAAVQKWQVYANLAYTRELKEAEHFRRLEDTAKAGCCKELADVLVLARQIEYLMQTDPEFKDEIELLMNEKADRQLARIKDESQ